MPGVPTGLRITGADADVGIGFTGSAAELLWFAATSGQPWTVPGAVSGITFAGGLTITPGQSGIVT